VLHDIRHAIRTLLKSPGFAAVAVLTLALGIGANTAIFSLVNSTLLRPLPVKDPSQIALVLISRDRDTMSENLSYPVMQDLKNQPGSPFSDLTGFQYGSDGISVDGKAYGVFTNYVPGNYFEMLGLRPTAGRLFTPSEGLVPGADPVIVLSYSLWKVRFGGDPGMIGKKVLVDGHPFTVIGITPEGFHGLRSLLDARAYIPLAMHVFLNAQATGDSTRNPLVDRTIRNLHVYARLKPGMSPEQANAALQPLAQQVVKLEPNSEKSLEFRVIPELKARPDPESSIQLRAAAGLFLALAAFVLVLACMNVANILLVRATLRRREMAIRAALGGTQRRIVQLLLTESVVLALLGGAGGLLIGQWLSGMLSGINLGTTLPIILDFSFDWRVFSYAFAAAGVTGILTGLVPAIRASRSDLMIVLRESGRSVAAGKNRFRSALVVAQVAGSLVLLIAAGLFTRSLKAAEHVDLGFDPTHLANFSMDSQTLGNTEKQGQLLIKNLIQSVSAIPGVRSVAAASTVPFGYYSNAEHLRVNDSNSGAVQETPYVSKSSVTPGYLQAMKIALIRGRDFAESDDANSQHVAIINDSMAQKFWPNQDAVGHEFVEVNRPSETIRVVGVVRSFRYEDFSGPVNPFYFTVLAQDFSPLLTLHVRTAGEAGTIIPAVEQKIESMSPGLPLFDVGTMTAAMNTLNGLLLFQVGAGMAATLGLLGLVLAIVGVYGIVSYVTSQRTNEIGIRMALGAAPGTILKMVLRQGLIIIIAGLAIGLGAAYAAGHLAADFLVGVSPTDPLTFSVVSVVLTLIALVACYIPARRATKVDPMIALRYE